MFKKIFIGTFIIAIAGILAVQMVNAGPVKGYGYFKHSRVAANDQERIKPCLELTEEQRVLMNEYREKKMELRSEMRKGEVDSEQLKALKKELSDLRASMEIPAYGERKGHRKGGSDCSYNRQKIR